MSEVVATLSVQQKYRVLLQIQRALGRTERPSLRACGLTEEVAQAVACELSPAQIVDLWIVADEGSVLDRCKVYKISDTGLGILARGETLDPPALRVSVEHPNVPFWQRTRGVLMSGLWDIVKIVLGGVVGILVGYFLWKYRWK